MRAYAESVLVFQMCVVLLLVVAQYAFCILHFAARQLATAAQMSGMCDHYTNSTLRQSEKPADQSHCQPNTPADDMKVSLLMDPHPQSGDTTDTGKHKIQDNAEFGKCERQHCQICEECNFSYMQD